MVRVLGFGLEFVLVCFFLGMWGRMETEARLTSVTPSAMSLKVRLSHAPSLWQKIWRSDFTEESICDVQESIPRVLPIGLQALHGQRDWNVMTDLLSQVKHAYESGNTHREQICWLRTCHFHSHFFDCNHTLNSRQSCFSLLWHSRCKTFKTF